jgi:hypothetical protein
VEAASDIKPRQAGNDKSLVLLGWPRSLKSDILILDFCRLYKYGVSPLVQMVTLQCTEQRAVKLGDSSWRSWWCEGPQ